MAKAVYKSKTIGSNAAILAAAGVAILAEYRGWELGPDMQAAIVAAIIASGNILLRLATHTAVRLRDE